MPRHRRWAMGDVNVLVLAFLGGVLTRLSPCILPVIPLVFTRAGRDFKREIAPMLGGLALAFTAAALLATATVRWLLVADEIGRYGALALLAVVGVALLLPQTAVVMLRPATHLAASLLATPTRDVAVTAHSVVIGVAIGVLWAPCAGPILGLLIAAAATSAVPRAALLFLTFALGAIMSLAGIVALGSRAIAAVRRAGVAAIMVRRGLGVATLMTVVALLFGWDRAIFAKGGLVQTASAEAVLVAHLTPHAAPKPDAGISLDDFTVQERIRHAPIALPVADGTLPAFTGGTEWINSAALTPEVLRGKVVLVEFWTFECYFGEGRYDEQDQVVAKLLAERDANAAHGGSRYMTLARPSRRSKTERSRPALSK
ncbi:MAG: cytochrome c biogenesis protein/redoxin [Gemmatimonadales bacterium]